MIGKQLTWRHFWIVAIPSVAGPVQRQVRAATRMPLRIVLLELETVLRREIRTQIPPNRRSSYTDWAREVTFAAHRELP